ncbi:MAG: NAD(P)/FAD-dependent oxidoreductase [Candidatus Nanopelagicales bacterium]
MPVPLDVLIIGAGLSGIGAAAHLRREYPTKSFTIIESRDAIGGTWDLFRYPGIRSDSDMFTMGYKFKPWTDEDSIAAGEKIRTYITDVASEYDITERIMFGHRAIHADWSSEDRTWTVSIRDNAGDVLTITTRFLLNCSGYYNYEQGFSPTFEGSDEFAGTIVHPQHWPEDLEYCREARGRDRQWRYRSDADAKHGQDCRTRHDVAAITDVHRVDSRRGSISGEASRACFRRDHLQTGALQEVHCGPIAVHDRPQGSQLHAQATSQSSDGGPARRLRLRHPSDSHLQTVGSASVRLPRW